MENLLIQAWVTHLIRRTNGTRCGTIDPAIVTSLIEHDKYDASMLNELLNKQSGVLGISGISGDFRDLDEAAQKEIKELSLLLIFSHIALKIYRHLCCSYGRDRCTCFHSWNRRE